MNYEELEALRLKVNERINGLYTSIAALQADLDGQWAILNAIDAELREREQLELKD